MPNGSFQEWYNQFDVTPPEGWEQWQSPWTDPLAGDDDFDWLDFLQTGMPEGGTYTPTDVDETVAGTQTTSWDWQGVGIPGGWTDLTGEDIADLFAQWGFGENYDAEYEGSTVGEAFVSQFGESYGFAGWGDPDDPLSYASQWNALMGEMAEAEAALWASYNTWLDTESPIFDENLASIYGDYQDAYADIEDQRSSDLKKIIDQRRSTQEQAFTNLEDKRRAVGRTGFGATGRYGVSSEMEQYQEQLSQMTGGAYDTMTGADTALDELATQTGIDSEQLWMDFVSEQESQLGGIQDELETMYTQYEAGLEGLFNDWLSDLESITTSIIGGDPALLELFEFTPYDWDYEGWTEGDEWDDEDPIDDDPIDDDEDPTGGCDNMGISCPEVCQAQGYTSGNCAWDGTGNCNCWTSYGDGFTCEAMLCPPGQCNAGPPECECVPCSSNNIQE